MLDLINLYHTMPLMADTTNIWHKWINKSLSKQVKSIFHFNLLKYIVFPNKHSVDVKKSVLQNHWIQIPLTVVKVY